MLGTPAEVAGEFRETPNRATMLRRAKRPLRRLTRAGLKIGAALVLGAVIAYYLFISCASTSLRDCDPSVRLVTAWWEQINYDRDSPDTGLDGHVTIVLFFSYDCAACRDLAVRLGHFRESDENIRIVFKHVSESGGVDEFAARAGLAAAKQDNFLPFHAAMIARLGAPTKESVLAAASLAGLDLAVLQRDMASPAVSDVLQRNRNLAKELGISSLPAVIVGERLLPPGTDMMAIAAAAARAKAEHPL